MLVWVPMQIRTCEGGVCVSGVGGDGCGGLCVYVGVGEHELRGTGCNSSVSARPGPQGTGEGKGQPGSQYIE